MSHDVARLLYLVSSVLFILGLRAMGSPKSARDSNHRRHASRPRFPIG